MLSTLTYVVNGCKETGFGYEIVRVDNYKSVEMSTATFLTAEIAGKMAELALTATAVPGDHYRNNMTGKVVEVQVSASGSLVRFGWEDENGDWKTQNMLVTLFAKNFTFFS